MRWSFVAKIFDNSDFWDGFAVSGVLAANRANRKTSLSHCYQWDSVGLVRIHNLVELVFQLYFEICNITYVCGGVHMNTVAYNLSRTRYAQEC